MTKRTGAAWIGLALLAGGLSACGQPQAPEPAQTAPAAQAAPELLGAPPVELAAAAAPAEVAPARRPGWGTMAPNPHPDVAERRLASAPAYRLVGPTAPEPATVQARASAPRPAVRTPGMVRARLQAPPAGWVKVGAGAPRPTPAVGGGRVRHWITPVTQR
jgi:hypothetical protein